MRQTVCSFLLAALEVGGEASVPRLASSSIFLLIFFCLKVFFKVVLRTTNYRGRDGMPVSYFLGAI